MFTLNGNRRPAPSFIVSLSMKKGKYVMPYLQKRIITSGVDQLSRVYGEVTEREIVDAFKSLDMKVSVNILHANIEKLDKEHNHILYNIVQNKRKKVGGVDNPNFGTVAYIYVIPKASIVGYPNQLKESFIAKMQSDSFVPSRDEMKMTNIFKFPRRQRGEIFVKSKAEADFFSKINDNAEYETIQALRVGSDYLVNDKKVKIANIKTDLHTIRCFDSETVAKEAFGQAFKFSITGSNYSFYANVNVKNLNPGLYRCVNKKEGYLFIEIFDSVVSGKVKMVHFLDANKEKTEEILISHTIQAAWTNPVY